MGYNKRVQTVKITDTEAVELINRRAEIEHRTASNAGAITVREALTDKYGPEPHKDTKSGGSRQEKT